MITGAWVINNSTNVWFSDNVNFILGKRDTIENVPLEHAQTGKPQMYPGYCGGAVMLFLQVVSSLFSLLIQFPEL
jgi:hypothetical protein